MSVEYLGQFRLLYCQKCAADQMAVFKKSTSIKGWKHRIPSGLWKGELQGNAEV